MIVGRVLSMFKFESLLHWYFCLKVDAFTLLILTESETIPIERYN